MEQIRITKELRDEDSRTRPALYVRPRFFVWENVDGARSSNNGEDFRAVLEEVVRIVEKDAVIPEPPKGKWSSAGCIVGDRWSVAWRVFDAQFWGSTYFSADGVAVKLGTPQRRRRIALVADFGGQSAPEILFERACLRRDYDESGEAGERTPANPQRGSSESSYALFRKTSHPRNDEEPQGWEGTEKSDTLNAFDNSDARTPTAVVYALDRASFNQGRNAQYNISVGEDVNSSIVAKGPSAVAYCAEPSSWNGEQVSPTLTKKNAGGDQRMPDKDNFNCVMQPVGINGDVSSTLDGHYYLGCGNRGGKEREVVAQDYVVRRLTPLECERLQGFQDNWTDIGDWEDTKGKKHKTTDSARYKALGNSICLPGWKWILKRISAQYERDAFMGSLFSGIGGFDYLWEQINGKGTVLWSSEIEEFCIAVLKKHFGG